MGSCNGPGVTVDSTPLPLRDLWSMVLVKAEQHSLA